MPDTNAIYTAVQQPPSFPGGNTAFNVFVNSNIKYPKMAHQNAVSGRVYVSFVVERDGSLSDLKVLRSPEDDLSAEAIRILKLSPKWIPGKQNNVTVRVSYTVPVSFWLRDEY